MRRLAYLVVLAVLLGSSLTSLSASTDCQRWFAAYRQELAHTRQVQRLAAAKRRAQAYARRKLAGFRRPAAKPHVLMARHPRMTPRQTLRHLEIACGILPEESETMQNVAAEQAPEFPADPPVAEDAGLLPFASGDLLAENATPAAPLLGQTTTPMNGGGPGYGPAIGAGGPAGFGGSGGTYGSGVGAAAPPLTGPLSGPPAGSVGGQPLPGAPTSGSSSNPPAGGQSAAPPTTLPEAPPPPAVVPEPASYVLLATGFAGMAGMVRRRERV